MFVIKSFCDSLIFIDLISDGSSTRRIYFERAQSQSSIRGRVSSRSLTLTLKNASRRLSKLEFEHKLKPKTTALWHWRAKQGRWSVEAKHDHSWGFDSLNALISWGRHYEDKRENFITIGNYAVKKPNGFVKLDSHNFDCV